MRVYMSKGREGGGGEMKVWGGGVRNGVRRRGVKSKGERG